MWSQFSEEHKNDFNVAKFDCTVPEHASTAPPPLLETTFSAHMLFPPCSGICEAQLITGYPTFVLYLSLTSAFKREARTDLFSSFVFVTLCLLF
jgi:hypothetical protein